MLPHHDDVVVVLHLSGDVEFTFEAASFSFEAFQPLIDSFDLLLLFIQFLLLALLSLQLCRVQINRVYALWVDSIEEFETVDLSTVGLHVLSQLVVKSAGEQQGRAICSSVLLESACDFDVGREVGCVDLEVGPDCAFERPAQV